MATPMSAIDELVSYIVNFTPEQLEQFLNHDVTLSILQPEEEAKSCLQEAS